MQELAARPSHAALPAGFAQQVVAWQRVHGRHGLPWQGSGDAYRVWLSEVMLQQTQVATVRRYFERFIARFPSVDALARAPQDEVLALWDGLGYYSRARNLHRCAQLVLSEHGGCFPKRAAELVKLPGIGPSTAAAIAAFCAGERVSIFDGNVQRLLARVSGFSGELNHAPSRRALEAIAQAALPSAADMPSYTQGLMDLGANVCTPRAPRCPDCPLQADCQALALGLVNELPRKAPKAPRRTLPLFWLVATRTGDGALWLEQRPARGIWGGLWSVPQWESEATLRDALCVSLGAALGGAACSALRAGAPFKHVLTHRDLVIQPLHWQTDANALPCSEATRAGRWIRPSELECLALPTALRRYLASLPSG